MNGEQGYFNLSDWKFKLMLLPIQHPLHCDGNQAEQTLHQILQEGKIWEIEPGKYKHNTPHQEEQKELSTSETD
jgi:hypothetical protein